jgi:hypothetical protein
MTGTWGKVTEGELRGKKGEEDNIYKNGVVQCTYNVRCISRIF